MKNEGVSWTYEGISLDEFFKFLYDDASTKNLNIEYITLFHLTTIINEESFRRNGLLNFPGLFSNDNVIKDFLRKFDIELVNNRGDMSILYKGKRIDTDEATGHPMLKRRTSWDRINPHYLDTNNLIHPFS